MSAVTSDSCIYVDRSVELVYPDNTADIPHADLERSGPASFDLARLRFVTLGSLGGTGEFAYRTATMRISEYLGYHEALAIWHEPVSRIRPHVSLSTGLLFLRGTIRKNGGGLFAPFLLETSGSMTIKWVWLGAMLSGARVPQFPQ